MKNKYYYTRGYCPVPRESRDFISYIKTQKNFLNKILLFDQKKQIFFYIIVVFLCYFLSFSIFYLYKYKNIHFFLLGNLNLFFGIFFVNFLYFFIFKEWKMLEKLTQNSFTKYEEFGISEGRVWKKSVLTLIQDNLILNYKIRPILEKIKINFLFYNFFMFLLLMFLINFL